MPATRRATKRRCRVDGLVLQDFGADGRLRCPLCLLCHWLRVRDSSEWTWAARHQKLYGRPPGVVFREADETVTGWRDLRDRLRKLAVHLHVDGARFLQPDQLVPLLGAATWEELQARLVAFETAAPASNGHQKTV
jgi:hypothetical protein